MKLITGWTRLGVLVNGDEVELREADEVGADEEPELLALLFALLAVPRVALVLHPHPQLVHLAKVHQDKVDRVPHLEGVKGT